MIHDNSLEAIAAIAPVTGQARIEVLKVIKENQPITRQDIAASQRWEINRVTGRVRELLDKNNIIWTSASEKHTLTAATATFPTLGVRF